MDNIQGAATPSGREKFVKDLALEINVKGSDRCETGKPYEHLKRLLLPMTGTDSWCIDTSRDNGCDTFVDC